MSAPLVAVIGGGLAGISAALACADGGARVVVVERRRRLGGLTWSFEHAGRSVDNGQHVFLRCCRAYTALLDRIGSAADVTIQERLDIPVLRAGRSTVARLRRRGLPAPAHLAAALARYPHLPLPDRLRLVPAAMALRRLELTDPGLDDETFGAWLTSHGQSPAAIASLWDLITVPTVNLPAAEASLAMGAKVFRTGLLEEASAGDIGWSRVPLGLLHGERSAAALAKAGVEVRLGEACRGVHPGEDSRWRVSTASGELTADAVIVAVPHEAAGAVLPPGSLPHQDRLEELGHSAVIDVHLVYERPVLDEALLAVLDSPVQWIFDRTEASGLAGSGQQYLAVSLSHADGLLGERPEQLADTIATEVGRLLPGAAEATVVDRLVTKERTATFRAVPGSAALRPPARTTQRGVSVAGAWTATGWPATMEGAVRSGRAAARCALCDVGLPRALPEEIV